MIDCFMELLLVSSEYTVPKLARITALQLEPVWFLMDQILYTSKQKQSVFHCIRSSHDRLGFPAEEIQIIVGTVHPNCILSYTAASSEGYALLEKQSKFPLYNVKCYGKRDTS